MYRAFLSALSWQGFFIFSGVAMAQPVAFTTVWQTVVNNGDKVPGDLCNRNFNSYNQPSVNATGLVVFRARSKGGAPCGMAAHGVYSRQMPGGSALRILDRNTVVPSPNSQNALFVEPPSFPRIDISSNAIATRGNHMPVWHYILPAGTSGIYTTPGGGTLVTGASKLGAVPGFTFFAVPGATGNTPFDVFPGAPSVTNGSTIVFKGNYTENGYARTGVYYRDVQPLAGGGGSPAQLIGNSSETKIPGTNVLFGSLAPPSAAMGQAVFAGFDNEAAPNAGGVVYVERLTPRPALRMVVGIGSPVPDEPPGNVFRFIGEGLSFDGRMVAFWGAWGTATRVVRLTCPSEGNKDRIAYCLKLYPVGYVTQVPAKQGIFVHDLQTRITRAVAKTGSGLTDFLYWNYSGRVPGMGEGEGEDDDGEMARWRSTAFMAVGSIGATSRTLFKAQTSVNTNGLYGRDLPGALPIFTILDSTSTVTNIDPEAPTGSRIVAIGLERDGFRNGTLAINLAMAVPGLTEEEGGWAGIYLAHLPRLPY